MSFSPPARKATFPRVMTVHTLTLTDDDPGFQALPGLTKSCLIVPDVDMQVWAATGAFLANGGATVATAANAATANMLFSLTAGEPFLLGQETQFDRVYGIITDGSGENTAVLYPGWSL